MSAWATMLADGVEGGLRLKSGAGRELLLLGCRGEIGQALLAAFCLYPFDLQVGSSWRKIALPVSSVA